MYFLYTIKDSFEVMPKDFGKPLEEVAKKQLRGKYERRIDKDLGLIVAISNIRDISDGKIFSGSPSTYHEVTFDALCYSPKIGEVVVGEVSELVEFGAFVRFGPFEGLVHVSQMLNDFISFDRKVPVFIAKESKKTLKKGDVVYAKISTVALKNTVADTKIAMTMRPTGLGKEDWLSGESL
jgi:DNA-directed RNA polymerase subunit E'